MNKITKAAMKRLMESKFFHDVEETVKAWDYYLKNNDRESADEMMYRWSMGKLALEYITGNLYGFSRDGAGNYSVVNERDYNDRIIIGRNDYDLSVTEKVAI